MMRRALYFACIGIWGLTADCEAQTGGRKTVAVDAFHNRERQPHYRWEGTYPGGYSELATLLEGLGVERTTIATPLDAPVLKGVACLIVVDPDTAAESRDPQFVSAAEISAVTEWVRGGGVLVMLGNDPGNAEFEHFNALAAQFGLEFLERVHKNASGGVKLTAGGEHPVFASGLKLYAVQVAPLAVKNPNAEILLEDNGEALMVSVRLGKGRVLALGDPWLYNEYIHSADNYRIAQNLFRWLLGI